MLLDTFILASTQKKNRFTKKSEHFTTLVSYNTMQSYFPCSILAEYHLNQPSLFIL